MKTWLDAQGSSILHRLIKDGCIDVVRSFRAPEWFLDQMSEKNKDITFMDNLVSNAAWNPVEFNWSLDPWVSYVAIICELHALDMPMAPLLERIWWEHEQTCRPSPASWLGVIGIAVGIDASAFRPFTWGATDLFCDIQGYREDVAGDSGTDPEDYGFLDETAADFRMLLVECREENAFYIELAICVLDWEVQAPQLHMLDRYRRLGGTTRVGYPAIIEMLPRALRCSYMYRDQEGAELPLLQVLERWKQSEALWSHFMCKTLATRIPDRCADIVLEFVLGLHNESFVIAERENEVIEIITHIDPPVQIMPAEAAEVTKEQWAQFVEIRRDHVGSLVQRLSNPQSQSGAWIESDGEMPPAFKEWTGEVQPQATVFGDAVYLVSFTRAGRSLQAAVEGSELETVRASIHDAGHTWRLQSGASVLLYAHQFTTLSSAVDMQYMRPHHVLISEAFLPLFLSEIRKLPSKANVRPSLVRAAALVADEGEYVAIVEKTFYNLVPARLTGAASVTQSLYDARAHHGTNPRRRQLMRD